MNKIGVAGARGQLGSSLMKVLGPTGLALDRANLSMNSIDSIIWAAGSASNRCTESEAEYELSSVQRRFLQENQPTQYELRASKRLSVFLQLELELHLHLLRAFLF